MGGGPAEALEILPAETAERSGVGRVRVLVHGGMVPAERRMA